MDINFITTEDKENREIEEAAEAFQKIKMQLDCAHGAMVALQKRNDVPPEDIERARKKMDALWKNYIDALNRVTYLRHNKWIKNGGLKNIPLFKQQ